MFHNDFDSAVGVIESLLDDYVTILIHVDAKAPAFKKRIEQYCQGLIKQDESLKGRLQVMNKSFNGQWGHSSLVFMQLEGFFELLRMNRHWKYAINLSGKDYPLRYNDAIYHYLLEKFAGKSLIEFFPSDHGKSSSSFISP
jgi:hypothetical protein